MVISSLCNAISDPSCLVSENYFIVDTNPPFEKITIGQREKGQRDSFLCFFSDNERVKIRDIFQKLTSDSVETLERVQIKRERKRTLLVDVHITRIDRANSDIVNYLIIFRKIDDFGFVDQITSDHYKLAILGILAGGVSHDINNKLSVILGYAALAEKRAVGNQKLEADLRSITKAASDATNLVGSLVKFCRSKDRENRSIKPGILVREIFRFAKAVMPATIDVKVKINDQCGYIKTDPVFFNDLFTLFIGESLHVLKDGGEFRVEVEQQLSGDTVSTNKILIKFIYLKRTEKIPTKQDKNEGIRANTLKYCDFLTAELGCTRIRDQFSIISEREVWLLFEEEDGAEFVYTQTSLTRDVIDGEQHILLVEDEEMLARLQRRALMRAGYRVTMAKNGNEGYEKWQEEKATIDLVLTDMTMPGLSGMELAEKIIIDDPAAKIILCTGYSDLVDEEGALSTGIKQYLSKPVRNSLLLGAIERCLLK